MVPMSHERRCHRFVKPPQCNPILAAQALFSAHTEIKMSLQNRRRTAAVIAGGSLCVTDFHYAYKTTGSSHCAASAPFHITSQSKQTCPTLALRPNLLYLYQKSYPFLRLLRQAGSRIRLSRSGWSKLIYHLAILVGRAKCHTYMFVACSMNCSECLFINKPFF